MGKSTNKKVKMMKIDIVIKFDVMTVAHSEVVQNTSTTPKLSIPDHITPFALSTFFLIDT